MSKINTKTNNKLFSYRSNFYSVFLFHGVIKKNNFSVRNYNQKHISEKKFIAFIKYIKKVGTSLSIDEIIYNKKNKFKLPKNAFNISFDDGFYNNYSIAAPILDDHNINTTFYFSTDFLEKNSMSWIDKIEYCFELTNQKSIYLPETKELNLINNYRKIESLEKIRKIVKNNFKIKIDKFVSKIFKKCYVQEINSSNNILDKKISWNKVKKLKNNKLFTIGGHSHEHLPLTYFSDAECNDQLNKTFTLFQKKIGINLKHFSYPEGQKVDYNSLIIRKLIKRGIICSPTAITGFNSLNSNLFHLKRIII